MKKDKSKYGKIKNILRRYRLLFLVIAAVVVSGCIVPGGDVFLGVFEPQRPATTEATADLIITQNLNIIPNPPIYAENGFSISFEVKNNDENEEVKNVAVNYYDSGLCKAGKKITPSEGVGETAYSNPSENIWLAHFSVKCVSETDQLYIPDKNDMNNKEAAKDIVQQPMLEKCNKDVSGWEATVYHANKVSLKVSGYIYTYECGFYDNVEHDKCKFTIDGMEVTFVDAKQVEKSTCKTGAIYCASQAEGGCTSEACSKSFGKEYFLSDYVSSPCYPWYYKNNNNFNGYCCKCDYTTAAMPTPTAPAAGAKTYLPLQTELFEWDFTAPSNKDIGNMPHTCGIKYKITYDFIAKTQTDVTVISKSKMEELQRAGQTPSVSPGQSVGVGPIKVFFDFGMKQPIMSGDILPLFITIEDKGSGVYGSVPKGKLRIELPSGFEKIACDNKFTGSGGKFENSAEIPLIKKKSPQLRCSFKTPSVTDIKTFFINARLDYTYKFDDEIKISINPTLVK